jgi:hypothetical protein
MLTIHPDFKNNTTRVPDIIDKIMYKNSNTVVWIVCMKLLELSAVLIMNETLTGDRLS